MNEKVKEALEKTIQKWDEIEGNFTHLTIRMGEWCALCCQFDDEGCNACPAQPLCNARQGLDILGERTLYGKINDACENLHQLLNDAYYELRKLKKKV